MAKFGIALEWGSRGLEFESQHSDQTQKIRTYYELVMRSDFLFGAMIAEMDSFLSLAFALHPKYVYNKVDQSLTFPHYDDSGGVSICHTRF